MSLTVVVPPEDLLSTCRCKANSAAVRMHAAIRLLVERKREELEIKDLLVVPSFLHLCAGAFSQCARRYSLKADGALPQSDFNPSDENLAIATALMEGELNEPLFCDLQYLSGLSLETSNYIGHFIQSLARASLQRIWKSWNLNNPLVENIRRGNVGVLRAMLHLGVHLYVDRGEPFSSPLHIATEVGNLEIVQLLLKSGADIHMKPWTSAPSSMSEPVFGESPTPNNTCDTFIRQQLFKENVEKQLTCSEIVPLFVLATKKLKTLVSLSDLLGGVPEIMHSQIKQAWDKEPYTLKQREEIHFSLAMKYLTGNGVEKNITEATRWFIEAAKMYNNLLRDMGPDQENEDKYIRYKYAFQALAVIGPKEASNFIPALEESHCQYLLRCKKIQERQEFHSKSKELQNLITSSLLHLTVEALPKSLFSGGGLEKVPPQLREKIFKIRIFERKSVKIRKLQLCEELADMYAKGKGVTEDHAKAAKFLLWASKISLQLYPDDCDKLDTFKSKIEDLSKTSPECTESYSQFMALWQNFDTARISKAVEELQRSPVCWYYQHGTCHFGGRCTNFHVPPYVPPEIVAQYTKTTKTIVPRDPAAPPVKVTHKIAPRTIVTQGNHHVTIVRHPTNNQRGTRHHTPPTIDTWTERH
ncbi:hypothetical protein Pelo_8610 [Pelomyxa schiedti]|nr:hypothetical protein Pelo_8610 [Pelomyxa schiedti]